MFTLPKKRMGLSEILLAILMCWKSLILSLLVLSVLCVLVKNLPLLALKYGLIGSTQKNLFLIMNIICFIAYLPPLGAMIYRVSSAIHDRDVSNADALKISLSRFAKLLILFLVLFLIVLVMSYISSLLSNIHVAVGKTFLILSALILAPYLTPAIPLSVIDNKWPFDAISSSFRLVNANWLFVFLTIVIVSVVTIALNFLGIKLGLFGMIVINIFTLPLTLTMTVLVTENLKLNK